MLEINMLEFFDNKLKIIENNKKNCRGILIY